MKKILLTSMTAPDKHDANTENERQRRLAAGRADINKNRLLLLFLFVIVLSAVDGALNVYGGGSNFMIAIPVSLIVTFILLMVSVYPCGR